MHRLDQLPVPTLAAAELARHDGVATVRALGLLGLGRGQIDRLVATGWWERAGWGVVRDCGAPRTWRQDLWAAVLAVGPMAVASHESAAAIHEIGGCVEGPVVLSVPRAARGMRPGMVVHGVGRLARPDVMVLGGMSVTSASRTIIDLAAIGTPPGRLGDVIDDASRLGLSSPAYLRRRLDALGRRGRAGVRLLDELMLDSG
ncbi:MAG TPA: type IV toxin-antitoxin system AbiEi family antitoxin domain-containing protein, partial [Ilumatobacteraceae bacterium]